MQTVSRPDVRPARPYFSSGPTTKRPGWSFDVLNNALLGRSHRAGPCKARLKLAIDKSRELLGIPDDYLVGIVPASDTGAVEMAMWSMLGERPVSVLAWESFGKDWVTDTMAELKLPDADIRTANFGALPDFATVPKNNDIVFTWNGTTSGLKVPNADWIADDRGGITICDATSAAFAMELPWSKLDVTTYSWQKVMGGEAAHGMLILSPRAVERLETYEAPRPLPKLFRLTKGGKLIKGIFEGATINTPSMLCVEDYIDTLSWGEGLGGLQALISRAETSLSHIETWVESSPWAAFLAEDKAIRSCTGVCLKIIDPWFAALSDEEKPNVPKALAKLLDDEGVAFDINGYRSAPPGLRIWCGATVEPDDVKALLPWLDWAYAEVKAGHGT
ncbi:MAG: phosphoserine transaminase [Pseudomonadota bacterium]